MDLPVDVFYFLLLLLMFSPPLDLPGGRACRFFGWWFGTLGHCCKPLPTQSLLLSFLLPTEADRNFGMASTQP